MAGYRAPPGGMKNIGIQMDSIAHGHAHMQRFSTATGEAVSSAAPNQE